MSGFTFHVVNQARWRCTHDVLLKTHNLQKHFILSQYRVMPKYTNICPWSQSEVLAASSLPTNSTKYSVLLNSGSIPGLQCPPTYLGLLIKLTGLNSAGTPLITFQHICYCQVYNVLLEFLHARKHYYLLKHSIRMLINIQTNDHQCRGIVPRHLSLCRNTPWQRIPSMRSRA